MWCARLEEEIWNPGLADGASSVKSRIISYGGVSERVLLPKTSCITSILKALPGRGACTWATLLQDYSHRKEAHTYLRHCAEVHDTLRAADLPQKEEMVMRYDKGVRHRVRHWEDLVMLYQKHSRRVQPK